MKKIFYLILCICFTFNLQAQEPLRADAGGDQHFCFDEGDFKQAYLGGNPTASGGVAPYTYRWWSYPLQYFFNDTTVANPFILHLGGITVYIEITDADGSIAIDSARITMSGIPYSFLNNPYYLPIEHFITKGDSIWITIDTIVRIKNNSTCEWKPTNGLENENICSGFWAKPDVTTSYSLIITDEYSCFMKIMYPLHKVYVDGVDINDYDYTHDFLMYPNPVSTELNIECKKNDFYSGKLSVFNIYGNKLFSTQLEGKNKTLNFSGWANGVYVLKFQVNNNVFYEKIIKM